MNDPISEMTEEQIQRASIVLVVGEFGVVTSSAHHIGLMIEKLQSWHMSVTWSNMFQAWELGSGIMVNFKSSSLQVAFLRTAQALGHWSPPKKVEPEETHWLNPETNSVITILPKDGIILSDSWVRVRLTPFEK